MKKSVKITAKKVSLVKGDDRRRNILNALELIKEDIKINGKNILIKPNLTATKNIYANTSIECARAVIDFLNKNFPDKNITISEGSGSAHYEKTTTKKVFSDFGYFTLLQDYKNVRIECIEDCTDFFSVNIKTIYGDEQVKIASRIKEFDYIISLGIPKTHNFAIATFGIKNMLGFIRQSDKNKIHGLVSSNAPAVKKIIGIFSPHIIPRLRRINRWLANRIIAKYKGYIEAVKIIHHNIANVCSEIYPDLVLIDGFYGMEGDGPVEGTPVKLGIAIASCDALKADGIGARIIGLKPEDIGYLYYLNKKGLGDYSTNGLVGEKLENCIKKIKYHPSFEIQKSWK